MKRCPQCNRTYADETITFCLADGTLLSAPYDPGATQILPSSHELLPTKAAVPNKHLESPVVTSPRRFNFSYILILILAALLAASAVALFYERGKGSQNSNSEQFKSAAPESSPTKSQQKNENAVNKTVPPNKNQARFSVTSCNSITDIQTGLEWLIGADRNTTWYEAEQWTAGLDKCGGSWRMPTIEEVRTLYNPALKAGTGYYTDGKYFPAHIDPVFDAIGGGAWVWSNEKVGDDARSFNLNQGKAVTYSAMNTFYSTRAFAVRNLKN